MLFMAVFLGYNQYWPGEFMFLWFYVQEHPKAQLAVVLVLKRLRSRGHSFSLIRQTGKTREPFYFLFLLIPLSRMESFWDFNHIAVCLYFLFGLFSSFFSLSAHISLSVRT